MATTNNAVSISSGLRLPSSTPPIGGSVFEFLAAFVDGDPARDELKQIGAASADLHNSTANAYNWIEVTNPNGVSVSVKATVGANSVTLGMLLPGTAAQPCKGNWPVGAGVTISASAVTTCTIGTTFISLTPNV